MTTIRSTPRATSRSAASSRLGTAEFEEGGLDDGVVAGACEVGGYGPDGLVGRFDAGAVGEDDDSSGHALLM